MRRKKTPTAGHGFSRREFLVTVGAGAPTIRLMGASGGTAPYPAAQEATPVGGGKFTPIDLGAYFNSSSQEFGTREKAALIGGDSAKDSLIRVPGGKRDMQGIPFLLGPEDLAEQKLDCPQHQVRAHGDG